MSRIGQKPVEISDKVKVEVSADNTVKVNGPQGELAQQFDAQMQIVVNEEQIIVVRANDSRENRALHGLTRALIANMVEGVTTGFEKRLILNGVGYRAEINGGNLILRVGFSHVVEVAPANGVVFEVPDNATVVVKGADKQAVGQVAAEIRRIRPVEPYRGQGIRYHNERLRRKAGKTRAGQ